MTNKTRANSSGKSSDGASSTGTGSGKAASTLGAKFSDSAEKLVKKARANPKKAIAAGVAVAAGVAAAAAVPLIRSARTKPSDGAKKAKPKKATSKKGK